MIVQQHDWLKDELLSELMAEIEEDRRGMHPSVTDLLSCLTKSFFNQMGQHKLEHTLQTKVFFFVGLGLERALLGGRKEKELVGNTDGIWWHVDSVDNGLVELKSTRTSKKKHTEEGFSQNWMTQVKSYCKAVGVLEVDLAVVYLIQADFEVYHLTFTQEEIDENWEWMLERKRIWDIAIRDDKAPTSFAYNQDWECKDCQYKLICDARSEGKIQL